MKTHFLSFVLTVFTVLLLSVTLINGQHFEFDSILYPDASPKAGDQFGWNISSLNNMVLVGAPSNDKNGINSGTAYLFELKDGSWNKIARFNPSDPRPSASFGKSVFISDQIIAIGAPHNDELNSNNGAVYVFKKPTSGWIDAIEEYKITNASQYENSVFGAAIHIHGDYLIAGATGAKVASSIGAAYIFKQSTNWESLTEIAKIESSESIQAESDFFGASVYMDDEQVIVGAPYQDHSDEQNPGSVFVFNKPVDEWKNATEDAILRPTEPVYFGQFGSKISYHSGSLIVSNNFGVYWSSTAGSAYIFNKPVTGWVNATEDLKIPDPLQNPSIQFGSDVLIDNQYAYVSARIADGADGKIFIFENSNGDWSSAELVSNLTHSETGRKIQMGESISISNGYFFSGAHNDNDDSSSSGSMMVFKKPIDGWMDKTNDDRITSADLLSSSNYFGTAIDIHENIAVVGAINEDNDKGIAYVFENINGSWTKIAKLEPTERNTYGKFGKSVAIFDQWIAVSSIIPEKVFMYKKPDLGWKDMTETCTIFPNSTDEKFGNSVDIYENTIVVGSSNDNPYPQSGAYLFEISGPDWVGGTELLRLGKTDSIKFKQDIAVSIQNNTIAIGAPRLNSVFIFEKSNGVWSDLVVRKIKRGSLLDSFGKSVSIYDNKVAIGSPGDDTYDINTGATFIYEPANESWLGELRMQTVYATNSEENANFGSAVKLYKNHLLVGAPNHTNEGKVTGAVFDFVNKEDNWMSIIPDMYLPKELKDGNTFGNAVAMNDYFLLIGDAKDDNIKGENSGNMTCYNTTIGTEYLLPPSDMFVQLKESAIVDMTWQDNSSGEKGFRIEYSSDTNFYSYSHIEVESNVQELNNIYITTQDTIVNFRIRAFSDNFLTTPSEVFPILITKKLIYTPEGFQLHLNSNGSVSFSWDSNNEYADEYILEYSNQSDFFDSKKITIAGDETEYDSLELELDQAYYFTLTAKNRFYTSEPTEVLEIFVMITGLDEHVHMELIYPNPSNDYIYLINNYQQSEFEEFYITNVNGSRIKVKPDLTNNSIDISDLKPGVYFVKFGDFHSKFVKE